MAGGVPENPVIDCKIIDYTHFLYVHVILLVLWPPSLLLLHLPSPKMF